MESVTLATIIRYLEVFAPLELAEEWDNVGLLVGDRRGSVSRVLTCLTVTPEVVEEAIDERIDLIVTHHPIPFRPLKRITSDTPAGKMILQLCQNGIAIYSPHTAFDSTATGINQMLAERIGLTDISPLKTVEGTWGNEKKTPTTFQSDAARNDVFGIGRQGCLETAVSCHQFGEYLRNQFNLDGIQFSGNLKSKVQKVGIACGSAGQFLADADRLGCDTFVTGETSFHTCLEARARGVSLFLLGHYGSERFAVEALADQLSEEFPGLSIKVSARETDPVLYLQQGA